MVSDNKCSVDGQWIAAKKDWLEAKRKYKMQEATAKGSAGTPEASPNAQDQGLYEEEMDEMRCILYLHGGAYCAIAMRRSVSEYHQVATTLGALTKNGVHHVSVSKRSVEIDSCQFRYSIQRYARKINGRVFGMYARDDPDTTHANSRFSHQLQTSTSVSVSLCASRCTGGLCVCSYSYRPSTHRAM